MYEKQDTFNAVASYLLRVNRQALSSKGMCLYRSDQAGSAPYCAAGCLIPDSKYNKKIEDMSCNDREIASLFEGHNLNLLLDLQICHDQYDVQLWDAKLQSIANDYGLEFNKAELQRLGNERWSHVKEG